MGRALRVARGLAFAGLAASAGTYAYLAWAADLSYQRIFLEDQAFALRQDSLLSTATRDALRDQQLQLLLSKFIHKLLDDARVEAAVIEMLQRAVFSPEMRPALAGLAKRVLIDMMRDAPTNEFLANLLLKLAADPRFLAAMTNVLDSALRNAHVQKRATDVAHRFLSDPTVREKLARVSTKHVLHIARNLDEYAAKFPLVQHVAELVERQMEGGGGANQR